MKTCSICKADISNPLDQYGGRIPVCRSCYLSGDEWAVEDKDIPALLLSGYSLDDAMVIENAKANKELESVFLEAVHEISLALGAHDG